MTLADRRECDGDDLADAIGQLHALHTAAHREMLRVIAAFDAAEEWRVDGATSVVPWLVEMLGVSHRTAAGWVRVAHALESLPAIASAYGDGRLSWDQVASLCRFATPESDADLAEAACGWSAAQTQAIARRARPVTAEEADEAHDRRSLRMWWDDEQRFLNLRGKLPDAQGAAFVQAIGRIADQAPPDPETGMFEPYEARCADALVELASARLAADGDPDRATVVVHADAAVLAGGGGVAELEAGPAIAADTARRLACDARWLVVADGPDGTPLGVGRTRRTVPRWLWRVVKKRDGGCRFPACGRERWVHAHHLVHWAEGGRTDADNLLLLCSAHHRVVHEGGWRVEGDPAGEVRFVRPDGRVLGTGPPGLRPELRRRLAPPLPPPPGADDDAA